MSSNHYEIASVSEFPSDGSPVIQEVKGIEIAVFRVDNDFHAIMNYCPHQSGPLCEGEVMRTLKMSNDDWMWELESEGAVAVCPWHNWRFDVRNGKNVDDNRFAVPTFDVTVKNETVYVCI